MRGCWEKWFAGPGICPLCQSPHSAFPWAGIWDRLCSSCGSKLHRIQPPCCPLCGRPWKGLSNCGDCLRHRSRALERNVGVLRYTEYVKELVRLLKYRGREVLAAPLGEMMAETFFASGIRAQAVTFVPLHPDKMRERGFNQAELLAREVARHLNLPLFPALQKVRPTPPQSRKSRRERILALHGVFRTDPRMIGTWTGKAWLVVDDVYTTGSTLLECAQTLKDAGVKRVYSLTLAR